MQPIQTTRNVLKPGDVFYFTRDPQYVHEYMTINDKGYIVTLGDDGTAYLLENHLPGFDDVTIIHNTHGLIRYEA